jgi:hypothetical protein
MGGSASDDILNSPSDADLRWARYLQQSSLTNTLHLHPNFAMNGGPLAYAGPSDHYGNQQHTPVNDYPAFSSVPPRMFESFPWAIALSLFFCPPNRITYCASL